MRGRVALRPRTGPFHSSVLAFVCLLWRQSPWRTRTHSLGLTVQVLREHARVLVQEARPQRALRCLLGHQDRRAIHKVRTVARLQRCAATWRSCNIVRCSFAHGNVVHSGGCALGSALVGAWVRMGCHRDNRTEYRVTGTDIGQANNTLWQVRAEAFGDPRVRRELRAGHAGRLVLNEQWVLRVLYRAVPWHARSEGSQVAALCFVHAACVCPCCMLRCMVCAAGCRPRRRAGRTFSSCATRSARPSTQSEYPLASLAAAASPSAPPCLVERLLQSPREYLWSALTPRRLGSAFRAVALTVELQHVRPVMLRRRISMEC